MWKSRVKTGYEREILHSEGGEALAHEGVITPSLEVFSARLEEAWDNLV